MSSFRERLAPYLKPRPRLPAHAQAQAAGPAQAQTPATANTELSRRAEVLAQDLARLTWDLGGLTYEMAIRDHFRVDVLVRQAARLQQVDAELGSLERLQRLEQAGAAGDCPHCGALYPRGAAYCNQCGRELMGTVSLPAVPASQPPPVTPPVPPPQAPQASVAPQP